MAAEEMTNRDIAQALFVTPKTVEMHLSNAFRKLGVNSRTLLGAALERPPQGTRDAFGPPAGSALSTTSFGEGPGTR